MSAKHKSRLSSCLSVFFGLQRAHGEPLELRAGRGEQLQQPAAQERLLAGPGRGAGPAQE